MKLLVDMYNIGSKQTMLILAHVIFKVFSDNFGCKEKNTLSL